MLFRFGEKKRQIKSWEEIREEIIEAIDEEKRMDSPLVPVNSVETYSATELDKDYANTTAQ